MTTCDNMIEARGKLVTLRNPDNGRTFKASLRVWPDYSQPVLFGLKIPGAGIDRILGGESDAKEYFNFMELKTQTPIV